MFDLVQVGSELAAALNSRFESILHIGQGGQGLVFRATRIELEDGSASADDVALKLLLPNSEEERLLREVAMMEHMRHPCTAELLEHGSCSVPSVSSTAIRYAAWRFIDGESLSQRIARGAVDRRTVTVVGRDVSTAIEQFWNQSVVHRDIKPDNVMLRVGERESVLIDLGAARYLERHTITGPGLVWGTLGYWSPEQARGERGLTCASDVYSLGITMFEALLGRHPYNHRQEIMGRAFVDVRAFLPTLDSRLAQLISQMLHPRVAFRPLPDQVSGVCADILSK